MIFDFIHAHVIGASGVGKSVLLKKIAIQEMHAGNGVLFVDPLGHNAYDLLRYVPRKLQSEVVYIDLADLEYPLSWNPLSQVEHPVRAAKSITTAFKRGFKDDKTPRLDIVLTNAILAAIETKGTLTSVLRFMEELKFRDDKINRLKVQNTEESRRLLYFWLTFADTYPMRDKPFESSVSRVRALLDSPECRAIFEQPTGKFHMDNAVDEKKIIINGAQGTIGEESTRLWISIFLDLFQISCQRKILPHNYRVIADEFWLYTTDTIPRSLSFIRNYKLSFALAHQYIDQVEKHVMAAVMANTDTKFIYRVSAEDAKKLAPEFKDVRVSPRKLADLENFEAFVLHGSEYTQMKMASLRPSDSQTRRETVIRNSRMRFCRKRV